MIRNGDITLEKSKTLCKTRNSVIKLFDVYFSIVSKAKLKATHGKGFKKLTSKDMLQRFPITPAQVKAGNTSENLLNKILQIIYYLYQAKEIPKKVYKNTKISAKL